MYICICIKNKTQGVNVRMKGKLIPALITTVIVGIGAVSPAFASQSSQQLGLTVIGGELTSTITVQDFDDVTIDYTGTMETQGTGHINVSDFRGTGEGWETAISMTPFTINGMEDPTSEGTLDVTLNSNNPLLDVSNLQGVQGQGTDGVNVVSSNVNLELGGAPITVVAAEPGNGMGEYTVDLGYNMDLGDGTVTVSNVGAESEYTEDDVVGVFAGTYESTVSITTGSGL